MPPIRRLPLLALASISLAGCATAPGPRAPEPVVAAHWHAPLPHAGELVQLHAWWAQFDDPLLARLVATAQAASPTVASAAALIAEAQAARVAGGAALLPALDATASASRSRAEAGAPLASAAFVGVQASWELDLFGGLRAGRRAAQAALESREAAWHDARVSVAAEVATAYADLRSCEAQAQQLEQDALSRARVADLTSTAARAGVRADASAAQAWASAADGRVAWLAQQAQCERVIKALVALTALEEPQLRHDLADRTAHLPQPSAFRVATVPAEVLAQRPDVFAAGRDVAAASATAAQADAQRWPRITLAGSLGATRSQSLGLRTDGSVWTLGPVSVTLPLFDGGVRRANTAAAQARHTAAVSVYAGRLRSAIQDVESALVTLHSAARRRDDASAAVDGHERAYRATVASYEAGAASLFELEDARRSVLAAQVAATALRREQLVAWISLYRATGGGWQPLRPVSPSGT